MAMPDQNGRAVAAVRLTDVELGIRRRYGRLLLERAIKEMDPIASIDFAAELHRAVETPSDRVYWVSAEAAKRVMG